MTFWYDYRAIAGQQAQRIKELEAQLANQNSEWDAAHKKAVGMVDNLRARVAELEAQYGELIFAVATKYPDETRHQTALRYIQQAENREASPACETKP